MGSSLRVGQNLENDIAASAPKSKSIGLAFLGRFRNIVDLLSYYLDISSEKNTMVYSHFSIV